MFNLIKKFNVFHFDLKTIISFNDDDYHNNGYNNLFSAKEIKSKVIVDGVKFSTGSKGKPKLHYGGYHFFQNNTNAKSTYWLCARNRSKKCKARIVMRGSGLYFITCGIHNHPSEEEISKTVE